MATEALEVVEPTAALTVPADLADVAGYIAESLAPATRRAYRTGLASFAAWCDGQGVEPLPASPETVAAYLAAEAKAGRSVSTLGQRVAAIRWAHESQGHEAPTAAKGVRATMQGIRREKGVAPARKRPLTAELLATVVPDAGSLKGQRDRALLLFGFASALRRSNLAALDLADLELTERGLLVTVRRSKTDQEGAGHTLAIPFGRSPELCPVKALGSWLEAGSVREGRVFRSVSRHERIGASMTPKAIANVVKQHAERAGLDADAFGGHSLRAGFVTSAAEKGATAERIMDHTGHRSHAMVRVYTRRVDAFQSHAGEGLL